MRKNPTRVVSFYACIIFAILCTVIQPAIAGNKPPGKHVNNFRDRGIRGKVTDASSGAGLNGASISVKGSTNATTTDANGNYSITVPGDNSILVVSFVGYVTQEVPVNGKSTVDVALASSVNDLAQVVVVGYGTQNKKDITGAVKSLKSGAFNKGIINSPQQLLQGKIAGVNVVSASGEPGGAIGITIRGPGGVRSGNTPLFVVDGIPLDNSLTGRGDPLNFLNPLDIESIDVLKDASATAIYGARGANGVVLITTKKGKAGTSTATFSTSLGVSKMARAINLFTADEFRKEVVAVGGILDDKSGNTDWQKEVTQTALTQNHNLALSGGSDKLTYYASFGMQKQEGIIKSSELDRYNGRFNVTQRFWDDRLTLEANLGVTTTKNDRPPSSTIIGDALANNPTYPAYDATGNPAIYSNFSNPLILFDLEKDLNTQNRVIGNLSASLKIVKGLVYKATFGIDNSNSTIDIQSKSSTVPVRLGRLETFYNYNRNRLFENYLTYNWSNSTHNVTALAGHSYQRVFLQGRNNSINNFPITPVEPQYNPGQGTLLDLVNNRPGGYATVNELQSFFGRVTYQYNSKYLATINFRADGSSKFGENNKYGYFPSFSLGWKISEEEFMQHSAFTNLKLRAGWGLTGNQEFPEKQTQGLVQLTTAVSYPLYPTGAYPGGIAYLRIANPDLKWETSKQTNIGLDFGLLKGALSGTIDVFQKVSSNILLNVPPPDPIQVNATYWTNIKDMNVTNKGVELDLEYRHVSKKGVSFNIGGNITYMKNNVTGSPQQIIPSGTGAGSGNTGETINGFLNGEPAGTFFLKQYLGIGADSLGMYLDKDKDGGITANDRVAAGTALPNVLYSFYGGLSYKGFDFNTNFNGVSGNKIYDLTATTSFTKVRLAKSVNTTAEAVEEPREKISNPAPLSTRYLKNGAYLRLNNVTLGYTFNTEALGLNKWITSLRLSVTGQNLFVVTDYDGYDPEVNADRPERGVSSYGIDYLSYPKARTIIFGLNLSF
ncbi:MAG: TonB-dependent receptor [Ferruginibacter sp.]